MQYLSRHSWPSCRQLLPHMHPPVDNHRRVALPALQATLPLHTIRRPLQRGVQDALRVGVALRRGRGGDAALATPPTRDGRRPAEAARESVSHDVGALPAAASVHDEGADGGVRDDVSPCSKYV